MAPAADPLVVVSYEELPQRYAEICGILSPDSLLRDFAVSDAKTGPPIGPGLRSVVRVTGGLIQYDKMTPEIHQVLDWQNPVVGGALERDERGRLVAFLETLSPLRSVQELNEHLGLSSFEMETEDTTLSTDASRPTTFRYEKTFTLPAGVPLPDIIHWRTITLNDSIRVEMAVLAKGLLQDRRFCGRFEVGMRFANSGITVRLEGPFEIHFA